MPPKKRARIGHHELSVSQTALARHLAEQGDGPNENAQRHRIRRELADLTTIWTPVGPVVQDIELPMLEDENKMLTIIHPVALLYHMCASCEQFAVFLRQCCQGFEGDGNLLLYTDECTTGNQLRHDAIGRVQTVYWSLKVYPHWWRSRLCGWCVFTFLPCDWQYAMDGGLAALAKSIIRKFFIEGASNFHAGIALPSRHGAFLFKCGLACFIQDEAAHKSLCSVKGASGSKPCLKCKNITKGITHEPGEEYWRDVSVAMPEEFDEHDRGSFNEIIARLERDKLVLGKGRFDNLQQVLGVVYHPEAAIFDPQCRLHFSPPLHVHEDWMHAAAASGGFGQYALNSFLLKSFKHGVVDADLDAFQQQICWPSNRDALHREFFRKRVTKPNPSKKEGSKAEPHLKCFASETIQAAQAAVLFAIVIIIPKNILALECRCLFLLNQMFDILGAGPCRNKAGQRGAPRFPRPSRLLKSIPGFSGAPFG